MSKADAQTIPITPITTGKKLTPLEVRGEEELARSIRDRQTQLDTLQERQDKEKGSLVLVAKNARRKAERELKFHKTIHFSTGVELADPVKVIFKDDYSEVDPEQMTFFKVAFGAELCAELFLKTAKVKAKQPITLGQLKKTLGDKFEAFCELFEVSEVIVPKGPFMERRAERRRMLTEDVNDKLDAIIDIIQHKPSVKTK